MEKSFRDTLSNKTAEELFEINKKMELEHIKEQLRNAQVSSLNNNNSYYKDRIINNCNKTLENIDEATLGMMRENANALYQEVVRLNTYCGQRSANERVNGYYNNIIEEIHRILEGFGERSETIFQEIVNTPMYDPEKALTAYAILYGLDVLSKENANAQISEIRKGPIGEAEIQSIATLEEKCGANMRFGVMEQTKEERLEELRDLYKVNSYSK